MAKVYKFTIQLSEFEMRKLICWAKAHGRPKATYAAQIIGARVESNIGVIGEMMSDIANDQNITVAELEKLWLEEENYYSQDEEK